MPVPANTSWLDEINWNSDGLVPAVAQDVNSGKVLTLAWMDREALYMTVQKGQAVYWSRSKKRLWRKGEESGHTQEVQEIYLDCDKDTIVLKVIQAGGIACHTGRQSCFFHRLENNRWIESEPVIKDPGDIYS
ncbi:MAG: hisI [Gammaproteobacteria bacterium]|nr:hisI [Gammaproteobacteria bacterium]